MRRLGPCFAVALATFTSVASAQDKPPVPTPQAAAAQVEARKLSDGFVSVAERVGPAVVQIEVTARDESAARTPSVRQGMGVPLRPDKRDGLADIDWRREEQLVGN